MSSLIENTADRLLRSGQRVKEQLAFRHRRARWRDCALPDFIIIGAQKAGTSSLFHYLAQHPQLCPSSVKEVHFFDGGLNPEKDRYQQGEPWYRAHFPLRDDMAPGQLAFEASPLYLFNPLAPERIARLLPNVKLIALLRDPVERAISAYFHQQRKGRETLPIMEALQAEEERLRPAIEQGDYKSDAFRRFSYKARGRYHEQLSRYLEYFPRDSLFVAGSEQFFGEPQSLLSSLYRFLGVDEDFRVPDLAPRNVGSNRHRVEPAVYDYLQDYFRRPNQEFQAMLDWDSGWR